MKVEPEGGVRYARCYIAIGRDGHGRIQTEWRRIWEAGRRETGNIGEANRGIGKAKDTNKVKIPEEQKWARVGGSLGEGSQRMQRGDE